MFKSENAFQVALNRLNAINNEWTQWQATAARKEHKDEFGDLIAAGETYYSLSSPGSQSANFKLSRRSMKTYLTMVFWPAPSLETLADQRLVARSASDTEAIKALE